tara:strand:+ start:7 stop:939 length:933 start_codon:yes stop_codon:yes gene_type:complete
MKINLLRVYTVFIILTFFLSVNVKAKQTDDSLKIQYNYQGKSHIIQGEKTATGYRFNAKSKKILTLVTLNWPPYISEDLCNKGWVFQFAVALLTSKGYQVNIQFYPWARSVKLVEQGNVDILFPEYFIESSAPSDVIANKKRRELLVLSNKFPGGEIALLKRKGYDFELNQDLSNLIGKSIGVVRGYQNTPEFDAMMDAKLFDVIKAVDELQLMKLLAAKRVDFIIGDPKVFSYSVNYSSLSNANKQALLNGAEQVYPALKYNHLYFAISKKYSPWRPLLDDINLALIAFQQSGETNRLIDIGSGCTIDF